MAKEDIYGRDEQPDVQKVADMAMKCMKGKTSEAESTTGPDASSSRDITGNLGQAKP